jgi:hypothetical protein
MKAGPAPRLLALFARRIGCGGGRRTSQAFETEPRDVWEIGVERAEGPHDRASRVPSGTKRVPVDVRDSNGRGCRGEHW